MFLLGLPLAVVLGFHPAAAEGRSDVTTLFRTPRASLEIPARRAESFTLGDLLEEYAHVSGLSLTMSEPTASALGATDVGLQSSIVVPAEDVHAVVGGLLHQGGFALAALHVDEPRVLWVYSPDLDLGRRPRYLTLDPSDADLLARHPALLVSVPITLTAVDARQVAKTLRPIVAAGASTIVAFDESHVTLSGRAADVAEWISMLSFADGQAEVGTATRVEALPTPFPDTALDAVDSVLKALGAMASDASLFELRRLAAAPSDAGTLVTLDLSVLDADASRATQRLYDFQNLLGANSWCRSVTDAGTLATATGVFARVEVDVLRPAGFEGVHLFEASEEEPSTTLRALAMHPTFELGALDIVRRESEGVADGVVQHELLFRNGSRAATGRPRAKLLQFLLAAERRIVGSRISALELKPAPATGSSGDAFDSFVFDARLVWRQAE